MIGKQKEQTDQGVWKNDRITVTILLFFYMLQGIPLGIIHSVTILLQSKNISYKDQALFSLSMWPFSMKLLWAPIVDSLYWKHMGRRKTWLIPTQYLIGIVMFLLSGSVSSLIGNANNYPNIPVLAFAFFFLNFLAATQDIAVDGWAITMLSRQNVKFATICNIVGQRTGYFLGNVIFLVLESPDFCNKYIRVIPQTEGIVTLSGFLKISGLIFTVATTFVLFFKSEKKEKYEEFLSIRDTYSQLYKIICLKNVFMLITLLLTLHIPLAATDAVTKLKFIEAGMRKENLALLETPLILIQILCPLLISRYISMLSPLKLFLKTFPYKLMFGLLFVMLVSWTHYVKLESGSFPTYYYVVILLGFILHQIVQLCLHMPLGSFYNQVSDPIIGGTYMTLLNTCHNLGYSWTSTLALWGVDMLTVRECNATTHNYTSGMLSTNLNHCLITIDGYAVEIIICTIFGLFWLKWSRSVIDKLHGTSLSEWKIPQSSQQIL